MTLHNERYFQIHPRIPEEAQLLILLNKMSKGQDTTFSEEWFQKLNNDTILDENKMQQIIINDFVHSFIPTDSIRRACSALTDMKMEGKLFLGNFYKFQSKFELKTGCSGIKDENVLKDLLKMTALADEPATAKGWFNRASKFYDLTANFK
ncbi:hypothetical protein HD554DRAFT_2038183 [Boletus coccyginus]|nr:hypothetical protein HD554DRAFT_2038183 [Boletus coccyginus]